MSPASQHGPSTPSQPRRLAGEHVGDLPDALLHDLQHAAVFLVVDRDQDHWFEPYGGTAIPILGGSRLATAVRYLRENPHHRTRTPMPEQRLRYLRWVHELRRLVPRDKRFTVFGPEGQGWVNPFTGGWEPEITAPDRRVTRTTVQQMASVLVACPQAQDGSIDRDLEQLRAIARRHTRSTPRKHPSEERRDKPGSQDMLLAEAVQRRQMQRMPNIDGYEMAVHYAAHSRVSGDFYTVLPAGDGGYHMLMGDVSGHGVQAALVVGPLLKAAKILARHHKDPLELLADLNDEIKPDLVPGQFVTCSAARLDPERHELHVALAGHHPGVLVNLNHEQVLQAVGSPGMAMGLVAGELFRNSLRPAVYELLPGDRFLQCTDGAIEAKNRQNEQFGAQRFLAQCILRARQRPQALVDGLAEDIATFAHRVEDDLTLLVLQRGDTDDESSGFPSVIGVTPLGSQSAADEG